MTASAQMRPKQRSAEMGQDGRTLVSTRTFRMALFHVRIDVEATDRAASAQALYWFERVFGGFPDGRMQPDARVQRADRVTIGELDSTGASAITAERLRDYLVFSCRFDEPGNLVLLQRLRVAESMISDYVIARLPRHLWIHGACLVRGNQAIVLVAPSGTGKTTLSLALLKAGFRIATDDVVLVDLKTARLVPFPRCPKVRGGAIQDLNAIGVDLSSCSEFLGSYICLPHRFLAVEAQELPRHLTFVFLRREPATPGSVEELELSAALRLLAKCSNFLVQDPEQVLFRELRTRCRYFRLDIGDLHGNVASILDLIGSGETGHAGAFDR